MSNVFTEEWYREKQQRVQGGVGGGAIERDSPRKRNSREPVANLAPAPSQFRSKWEAAYSQKLDLEVRAGVIKAWMYEPMSFKLAKGKRYRPDFLIQYPLGMERQLEFVEIKGHWVKNRRDGLTHLKWAAQLYPMFRWTLTWRTKDGWESENVEV